MYAPKEEDGTGEKVGFSCTGWPLTSYTPPPVTSGPDNVPPRAILPFFLTIHIGQFESSSNIGEMVFTCRIKRSIFNLYSLHAATFSLIKGSYTQLAPCKTTHSQQC